MKVFYLLKILSILFFFTGGNSFAIKHEKIKAIQEITLLLDWKPNTNHLGFYVAKSKGYYENYGINLKILNPTQTTTTALVGLNKANFGISYANNLIYARNSNIPIIAIAGLVQSDTSCFVWRKTLNIKTVKDLEGKRYGGWGSPEENATLKFIMDKNGADFSKVKVLTTGSQDFLPATLKNVDFTWEYKGWNVLAAELNNVEVGTYCPAEHFVEFDKPSPMIITSEKMLRERKNVVKNFMLATTKGFQFAIQYPEEAANEMLRLHPELDAKLVKASAKFLAPLYQGKNANWGALDYKKFENYANWMQQVKLINKVPISKEYLTNEFIN